MEKKEKFKNCECGHNIFWIQKRVRIPKKLENNDKLSLNIPLDKITFFACNKCNKRYKLYSPSGRFVKLNKKEV